MAACAEAHVPAETPQHLKGHASWQTSGARASRRHYITAVVRQRPHQRGFRQRVLRAYQQCCAICRLRHDELLEASHILPDGHPLRAPVVPNGLASSIRRRRRPGGTISDRPASAPDRVCSPPRARADVTREAVMPTTRSHRGWSRRELIGTAAAAAGATLAPGLARAQGGPWAQRPPGTPGSVTFVVWQYGKIYEQIARQFEDDWGVKVNQIIE